MMDAPPTAGLLAACLLALSAVAACGTPAPIAPVSPGRLADTPVAGGFGVIATASATPGPSPTPTRATTRVAPPPEPLVVPDGFGISVFADLANQPGGVAQLAVASNGDVFGSIPGFDQIVVLPDRDNDGVADSVQVFASGGDLHQPYALAFAGTWLYVACNDRLVRFPYRPGDQAATAAPETVVDLPAEGAVRGRGLAVDARGEVFVSVPASCNACAESDPRRAALLQFDADGGTPRLLGAGLRGTVALAFNPKTGDLWGGDVSRDGLGDDRPPDEINRLVAGHFGWPFCYGRQEPDVTAGGDGAFCAGTLAPAVMLAPHSGPQGLAFYVGRQFPEDMRDDLFVAYHGSDARRSVPTGYNVVRIPFDGADPTGEVFDFVSGWLRPDTRRWGSPAGLAVARDGSLLIADDGGKRVYRVYYHAQRGDESS